MATSRAAQSIAGHWIAIQANMASRSIREVDGLARDGCPHRALEPFRRSQERDLATSVFQTGLALMS